MQIDLGFWLPIAISSLSLVVAGIALSWNIYRDVVLKARVDVRLAVVRIMPTRGGRLSEGPSKIRLLITNRGPGPVQIEGMNGKLGRWWTRLFKRFQQFVVLNDHTEPLNPRLPARLDVGQTLTLLLPHDERSFLSTNTTQIGVRDSFGRTHMAPRRDLRQAKKQYQKDFGGVAVGAHGQ